MATLTARDNEKKSGTKGHTSWAVQDDLHEYAEYGDGDSSYYPMEEEEYDGVHLAELHDWLLDAAQQFEQDPGNEVVAVNFKEARKAMADARTNRGFYQPAKGKGKGKVFQGNCLRCGRFGHRASDCPQRSSSMPGKGNGKFSGKGNKSDSGSRPAPVGYIDSIFFGGENMEKYLQKAILDSGATANVMGIEAAEKHLESLKILGFDVNRETTMDRNYRRKFRFGNDEIGEALGVLTMPVGIGGVETKVEVRLVEGAVLLLIGANFLKDRKAHVDFDSGALQLGNGGQEPVRLESGSGGHLLVSLDTFRMVSTQGEAE